MRYVLDREGGFDAKHDWKDVYDAITISISISKPCHFRYRRISCLGFLEVRSSEWVWPGCSTINRRLPFLMNAQARYCLCDVIATIAITFPSICMPMLQRSCLQVSIDVEGLMYTYATDLGIRYVHVHDHSLLWSIPIPIPISFTVFKFDDCVSPSIAVEVPQVCVAIRW